MKRHLILLFSLVAVVAAAQGIPHNMVSRHTPVNTNLIGAVVGEGLSLSNGVLIATGGGSGGGGTDGEAVTNIVNGIIRNGGYTITNTVTFSESGHEEGGNLIIWRNNNGREIFANDVTVIYRSRNNSFGFKDTDVWLDSWGMLFGGTQSLPDYISERTADFANTNDLGSAAYYESNAFLFKSERDLHWDSATNIVWKNVYSNGWVYLMPFARTEEVTQ